MYRQTLTLYKVKLSPFASFFVKLTPTLRSIEVERRMKVAGGLWRLTRPEYGTSCNNKRINKAITIYKTNPKGAAKASIILPPLAPKSNYESHRLSGKKTTFHTHSISSLTNLRNTSPMLRKKMERARKRAQSIKSKRKGNVHKSKTIMAKSKVKTIKRPSSQSIMRIKPTNAKLLKNKIGVAGNRKHQVNRKKPYTSNKKISLIVRPIQTTTTTSLIPKNPSPVIYLQPSHTSVSTVKKTAIPATTATHHHRHQQQQHPLSTHTKKKITWQHLMSNKRKHHTSKLVKKSKSKSKSKVVNRTNKKSQSKSQKSRQKHARMHLRYKTPTQRSFEHFRVEVMKGHRGLLSQVELHMLQLFYRATSKITDFRQQVYMGKLLLKKIHELKMKNIKKRQHAKRITSANKSHKHIITYKPSAKGKHAAKIRTKSSSSSSSLSSKLMSTRAKTRLHFRNLKNSRKKYVTKMNKKGNRINKSFMSTKPVKTQKTNVRSLPLPQTFKHNRQPYSFSHITKRAKIKTLARRENRKSHTRFNKRHAVSGKVNQHKAKKTTRSAVAKQRQTNKNKFLKFFHAMMSTGKIPNKPPSARSIKIKELWKLVHHCKTHNERVRLCEKLLNGKLTQAQVVNIANKKPKTKVKRVERLNMKADDFKFAIVPVNRVKN